MQFYKSPLTANEISSVKTKTPSIKIRNWVGQRANWPIAKRYFLCTFRNEVSILLLSSHGRIKRLCHSSWWTSSGETNFNKKAGNYVFRTNVKSGIKLV